MEVITEPKPRATHYTVYAIIDNDCWDLYRAFGKTHYKNKETCMEVFAAQSMLKKTFKHRQRLVKVTIETI